MDEFEFHPSNWTPGDTTFENPNYHEFTDQVIEDNPDTDFRTTAEKEQDAQAEAIYSEDSPANQALEEQGMDEFPTDAEAPLGLNPEDYGVDEEADSPFEGGVSPFDAPPPSEEAKPQFSEKEETFIKSHIPISEKQVALMKDFEGEHNMEQVLNQVNTIRNDEELTAVFDRDGDGEYTIADRYDLSRLNLNPEQVQALNERWLKGLEEKDLYWRLRGMSIQNQSEGPLGVLPGGVPRMLVPFWVTDGNMTRYIHRRRMHALTEDGGKGFLLGNEGIRQNIIGPGLELARNTLGSVEKTASLVTGGDFITAATPVTDFIFNDKDPMSANYMRMDPIQKTFGDSIISEITYYGGGALATYLTAGRAAPALLSRGAVMAGSSTKAAAVLNAGAGGMKYLFGGGMLAKPWAARPGLIGWMKNLAGQASRVAPATALETTSTAFFRDLHASGFDDIDNDHQVVTRLAKWYPETWAFGRQMHAGIESPLGKQLAYTVQTVAVDVGFTFGLMGVFRGFRHGIPGIAKNLPWGKANAAQLKTSTYAFDSTHFTQPIKDGKYYYDIANEKSKNIELAAERQMQTFDEGPGNIYYNPDNTPAQDFSTYGTHKNGQEMPGQGTIPDVTNPRQALNDLDEIDTAVTIEGGSTGQLINPVQLRESVRFGMDDSIRRGLVNTLINDPVYKAQINSLPKAKRTIGHMHDNTLKRLQELEGRDAGSLTPGEFWGKFILDQPLTAKAGGEEISTWTVENLQIADALNRTLLMRVRDLAAGGTEMLGKTDIFATDGVMRNIADNLVLGLSEAKRTRYTWGLVRETLNQNGGKLDADVIRGINANVAKRADQIHGETQDAIRLMMRMLENNDSQELAEGMLEAFQMSNKIHNWKDFDAFIRSKIKGGEFDGKVHTGAMIRELQAVMVNSILSGPKTPLRAILGTTTNAYYNSFNEAAGALIRTPFTGDLVQRRVAFAKAKGMIELIPEAYQVFRNNIKSKFSGDFANIRTRYSEAPTQGDLDWDMVTRWTERNGTDGDKAALYITDQARKLNNNKLLGWSPRVMAATDDTFKWLLARVRSKEMGLRQVIDELGDSSADITPDMLKKAEDIHMNNMLDIDGNIDLRKDAWLKKQFEEITLTGELKGFAGALDKVMNEFPLTKPFYLFARTGINGLNLTLKNTPGIALLHKETIDILRHTGDDFTELARYGITNANDLANAKSLITGRQAVGSAVVSMMGMKYMSGQLTGNGPADKQLRQNWVNAGWKPNHIYFGNVGFDYSSIEPFNVIFSSIADVGDNIELMGSDWAEKRFQAVAFVLGRGLTSKTYMSGLDNMMQLIQMKPWAWNKTAANVLNNSIPLAGMRNEFGKFVNPHMKELNSDIWSGLRNRNQATEFLARNPLTEKSDLLNGKPINNWNFIGRAFNAVSPIQIDYKSSSPGRKLLLDSNYDLKSTTYAYKGFSFVENAQVRSHFQNAIGNASITYKGRTFKNLEKALDFVATQKDIQISMAKMNANRNNPSEWDINPTTYPHNTVINNLMQQARAKAWAVINDPNHPGYSELLKVKTEKDGLSQRTRDNRQEILDLSFPQKKIDLFPKN